MDTLIAAPRPLRPAYFSSCPSPVPYSRATPPAEAFAKIKLTDSEDEPTPHTIPSSTRDIHSHIHTSCSCRLTVSQEALEEFLSILRPSVFPIRVNRRLHRHSASSSHHAAAFHSTPYERPHPYRFSRKSGSSSASSGEYDDTDSASRKRRFPVGTSSRTNNRSDGETATGTSPTTVDEPLQDEPDWRNFILGSPISRNQTRNPLPRHPSYEALSANLVLTLDPVITSERSSTTPPPRPTCNPFMSPNQTKLFTQLVVPSPLTANRSGPVAFETIQDTIVIPVAVTATRSSENEIEDAGP